MKAVFFDVDGTLIDCVEKKIPASSIKAIEELRKNGYKVALATGGLPQTPQSAFPQLFLMHMF